EVGHRRGEDRREPERVDAEPVQVVEPAGDAAQVADAVAVAVLERARVDLVDDPALPPVVLPVQRGPPSVMLRAASPWAARPAPSRPGGGQLAAHPLEPRGPPGRRDGGTHSPTISRRAVCPTRPVARGRVRPAP